MVGGVSNISLCLRSALYTPTKHLSHSASIPIVITVIMLN